MARLDGYDYDEYAVYIDLTCGLEEVIRAGCEALGIEYDESAEINWVDSHN